MNSRSFSLKPFTTAGPLPDLKITGNVHRRPDSFSIRYLLAGRLQELVIPSPAARPERRNALWEETCFEFFLAMKDSGPYWEFNLSPAGHWNAFRFESYRQGMREETAVDSLPFMVERSADALLLSLELDLGRIVPAHVPMNAGISAVIKHTDGCLTFWALSHPGTHADFHRRESFIIGM
ncbi:MAG: hypothetical protein C4560_05650 [Nitrospiraceae bacterium]|nr:MAG: hypothetical protein C4560_05650 [Nitrospiraceae bacterium]